MFESVKLVSNECKGVRSTIVPNWIFVSVERCVVEEIGGSGGRKLDETRGPS